MIYAYRNTGSASNPSWTYWSPWGIPVWDYYTGPTLVDLDFDGDYDLVVGRSLVPPPNPDIPVFPPPRDKARIRYFFVFRNTGSPFNPSWEEWEVSKKFGMTG
jgi:hypothetical protein